MHLLERLQVRRCDRGARRPRREPLPGLVKSLIRRLARVGRLQAALLRAPHERARLRQRPLELGAASLPRVGGHSLQRLGRALHGARSVWHTNADAYAVWAVSVV